MKRSLTVIAWSCMAMLIVAVMAGCGGGGTTATPVAPTSDLMGVEALGAMDATANLGIRAVGDSAFDLNPFYSNSYLVPSRYSVALVKFELMKSEDDATPYVVFDTESVENPKIVDLTSGASDSFGENSQYPDAGTYTHVRMSVVYFESEMTMDQGEGAGVESASFRMYASSVGNILNGDVVQLHSGKWYWMSGTYYDGDHSVFDVDTDTGPRPDDQSGHDVGQQGYVARSVVVQDFHFSQGDDESPDPFVVTLELPNPIVIPANPTGMYKITATFNVAASSLDPNATGVFLFDDVDSDGIFEPGPGMGEVYAGGRDYNDGTHGEPMYSILPPEMNISFTKVEE